MYDSESAGSPSAKSSGSDALGSPKKLTDVTEEEEVDSTADDDGKTQEEAKKGTVVIFNNNILIDIYLYGLLILDYSC